ncbi:MAG: putative selenate ABC transporter substrate-binding protein [Actinobacteria bacterium]|nr:putative selenate ABC transporter substrate-binding protein [Actinomycetota bacterium]
MFLVVAVSCGGAGSGPTSGSAEGASNERWNSSEPLMIGAIPDQEPQELQRLYGAVAEYLSESIGVPVEYLPVTDYTASVSLFGLGDLDLVWYGGLTGVQARLQVDNAKAIVQRDIDEAFHSVFIANTSAGLAPFDDALGLSDLEGTRFTFGSESSTSGRLMPQFFLAEAGLGLDSFEGEVGFSGDHDKTIDLVEAGTYEAGVLNEQVWDARVEEGDVDTDKVVELVRTPPYHDYHWVIHPEVEELYGEGFIGVVVDALIALDRSVPEQKEILDLFGAGTFIETTNENYRQIEEVARSSGLIE